MPETTVLVTGASGFLGKNLRTFLRLKADVQVIGYDLGSPPEVLERGLREADVIFHLAGINRPQKVEEFAEGNTDFTAQICERLQALDGRRRSSFPPRSRPTRTTRTGSASARLKKGCAVSRKRAERGSSYSG